MKRELFMLLFVLTGTIAVSAQQAVYNYYPRIVMGSTVEQVKQKMKGYSGYKFDKETNLFHFRAPQNSHYELKFCLNYKLVPIKENENGPLIWKKQARNVSIKEFFELFKKIKQEYINPFLKNEFFPMQHKYTELKKQ